MALKQICIPYKPRYPEIHKTLEATRFCVIVAHRRFGKTVLALNHMIKQALLLQKPMGRFAFVAPLLKQAKESTWEYLKHYTAPILGREINESELVVKLPTNAGFSRIRVFGADNPDSLRGSYLDGAVLDEVAQMKPEVWGEVIRPMLADRPGWALFIGTPKGINLFSELYYRALREVAKGNTSWSALCFPVDRTQALSEEEIEDVRRDLSENEFRQEMLCDFTVSNDNVLLGLGDVDGAFARDVDEELVAPWPLVVGVDVARFGSDASVFFRRRGLKAYEPVVLRNLSNVDVAQRLLAHIAAYRPRIVNIDQGQGTGVIDLVRELCPAGVIINEVPFGSRAGDDRKFANRRAEMWFALREWIRAGGSLSNGKCAALLRAELTAPEYGFDISGRIKLEAKEAVKERLRRSTDLGDALALTFAVEMGPETAMLYPGMDRFYGREGAQAARDWIRGREKRDRRYEPFE